MSDIIQMIDRVKEVVERGERNKRIFVPLKVGQTIKVTISRDAEEIQTIDYAPTIPTTNDTINVVRAVITFDLVEDLATLAEKCEVGLELAVEETAMAIEQGLTIKESEIKP
jgi:hypothetical protein